MLVNRVEQHQISKSNKFYKIIDELCFKSKNIYNYANYITRQIFIITSKLNNNKEVTQNEQKFLIWINEKVDEFNIYKKNNLETKQSKGKSINKKFKQYKYFDKNNKLATYDFIEYVCKHSDPFIDLSSQCSQSTLRVLDKNWKSFFVAIKDWSKNPSKYLGRPKLPKYKKKDGRFPLYVANNQCRIEDGFIYFSWNPLKPLNNSIKTKACGKLMQIRFIPRNNVYIMELIYQVEIKKMPEDTVPTRICGIDLGLNNFATLTNNIGAKSIVINGKVLKSINQYYNKQLAFYRSILKKTNHKDWSNRLDILTLKRFNKIKNYMHKASKQVIEYCLNLNIDTIIIGNNQKWKQESNLHKSVNQTFVQIPYEIFINMVQYKAENVGINVIITKESYTSGTSFLDIEMPIKTNYDKSRRVFRGLFVSNMGVKINSDVNGSYQIIKKVVPNAFSNGIEGVDLHPVVINI